MNFLQIGRISCERVALNIMTCFWVGVARKISWTSRRISDLWLSVCTRFGSPGPHTNLVEHLVTLIENEHLDTSQSELLLSHQRVHAAWRSDNDMGVGIFI